MVLTLSAEARERVRGLLAPLVGTPMADTRVSLLTASRSGDGDSDGEGRQGEGAKRRPPAGEEEDRAELFARFGLFKLDVASRADAATAARRLAGAYRAD